MEPKLAEMIHNQIKMGIHDPAIKMLQYLLWYVDYVQSSHLSIHLNWRDGWFYFKLAEYSNYPEKN